MRLLPRETRFQRAAVSAFPALPEFGRYARNPEARVRLSVCWVEKQRASKAANEVQEPLHSERVIGVGATADPLLDARGRAIQ
jgi:hypothetical protein